MKITAIRTFIVNPGNRNYIFVRVDTDDGIHGVGEAYSVGPDDALQLVIRDFAEWIVGRDPRDVEFLWQLMYNGSRFPGGVVTNAAISGIEHALWDIKGKAAGIPVYQMLGGKARDRVRVYQNPGGRTPEEMAERSVGLIERYGFTALKINPHPPGSEKTPFAALVRGAVARLEAVRRAVGDDIEIGVDPHARIFEPIRARQMAEALKPYRPFFIEEPIRPENIDAMAELRHHLDIPLATGEMLYTKYEFRDLLARGAADIIQPDVCCAGGLLEQKKIAAMAEAFYVTVAPHNPMGPVATAVNVHFAASTPNFLILEYTADDTPGRRDLVQEPMQLVDGYLELPTAPGLGIELNEDAFGAYPFKRWHRAFPIGPDGAMGYP
ncbi:MAG: galactonate dehydratase [Chloroflexota bacterium]|nr:MAG: galactonate dehydratase [Chloroflexota bacterium]